MTEHHIYASPAIRPRRRRRRSTADRHTILKNHSRNNNTHHTDQQQPNEVTPPTPRWRWRGTCKRDGGAQVLRTFVVIHVCAVYIHRCVYVVCGVCVYVIWCVLVCVLYASMIRSHMVYAMNMHTPPAQTFARKPCACAPMCRWCVLV